MREASFRSNQIRGEETSSAEGNFQGVADNALPVAVYASPCVDNHYLILTLYACLPDSPRVTVSYVALSKKGRSPPFLTFPTTRASRQGVAGTYPAASSAWARGWSRSIRCPAPL